MAKSKDGSTDMIARIDDDGAREGHGTIRNVSVKKGEFLQVGSAVDLAEKAYSPNQKTGTSSGTSEH